MTVSSFPVIHALNGAVGYKIGIDNASATSPEYAAESSRSTGTVDWVQIDIDEAAEDLDHLITEEERYRVAMARQ